MKKLLLVGLLTLAMAIAAFADIPHVTKSAMNEAIVPHGSGGATGTCSIIYYNMCSGWLWTWSGWLAGDEVGVVFDMPTDCGKIPGEPCTNTVFWWYWRYTTPGWGYTVTYNMYDATAQYCKTGPSYGTATQDPTERWNYNLGLGGPSLSDLITLTATWDKGGLPRLGTDNNNKNYMAPVACPGFTVGPIRTVYFGGLTTQYCPPQYLADNWGPVQCLMDAEFFCGDIGTQESSWTGVKSLFR
ncbi:MAG: hypothetical protein ABIH26_12655 [Candidatus Eisenbacteria bacterium]